VVMLLKGESSHWINQSGFIAKKFAWQNEYFAVSVSESLVPRVRKYIAGQEEHHRRKTFQEEYDEIMSRYGFNRLVSG
jgi:REP element-mobilizing transposase RayT